MRIKLENNVLKTRFVNYYYRQSMVCNKVGWLVSWGCTLVTNERSDYVMRMHNIGLWTLTHTRSSIISSLKFSVMMVIVINNITIVSPLWYWCILHPYTRTNLTCKNFNFCNLWVDLTHAHSKLLGQAWPNPTLAWSTGPCASTDQPTVSVPFTWYWYVAHAHAGSPPCHAHVNSAVRSDS